jgi:hypothetical protein
MAAKELINMIHPIVAISTYITFIALALYEHSEFKNMLLSDADAPHMFVQEVRRFYPFTPFVGEKVKIEFEWNGCEFIPHGGGDPDNGYRCPGESITVEIMKATLDFLVNKIDFKVPNQDLSYNMARIPTLPKSGFIINNVITR